MHLAVLAVSLWLTSVVLLFTDWLRFGIHPVEVHGAEVANYAKYHALEKEFEETCRKIS